MMKLPPLLVLVVVGCLSACGGGSSSKSTSVPTTTPVLGTTYPVVLTLQPVNQLEGTGVAYSTDFSGNALATATDGSATGRITANSAGIQTFSLTVNSVAGATFSDQFSASDLATSTPVPGTTATLKSGSKSASDSSVRSLTVLDPGTSSLSYLVLGEWDYKASAGASSASGSWFVFGAATRVADLPTTGTATYSGLLVGRYADGSAIYPVGATATANADFVNRSVAFSTTNTQLGAGGGARSDLNMSGTLTYGAASNALSGSLTTAGPGALTGPATGKFYGPAAAELGGSFFLQDGTNGKQMAGSFGLKR